MGVRLEQALVFAEWISSEGDHEALRLRVLRPTGFGTRMSRHTASISETSFVGPASGQHLTHRVRPKIAFRDPPETCPARILVEKVLVGKSAVSAVTATPGLGQEERARAQAGSGRASRSERRERGRRRGGIESVTSSS